MSIILTQQEWKESVNAMKILQQEITKMSGKNKNNSVNDNAIFENINKINDIIFSKDKYDDPVTNLSYNDFNTIMDEIMTEITQDDQKNVCCF